MVSVVLLTTEEVLQKNTFWYSLDTAWATEEMEPFEEVKFEHMFTKPLSRDFYYARYPDIPRSESDEETSLSLNGFKMKYSEWKSKVCLKRIYAQRRNSNQSYFSYNASKNESRRVTSLVHSGSKGKPTYVTENKVPRDNDERVLDFLRRLHENIPPPPIEDLQHSRDISSGSLECPMQINEFNVELPEYEDFAINKIMQTEIEDENLLPTTSTLKKSKRKVSFNLKRIDSDFDSDESWYDSIYGVSDLILRGSDNDNDRGDHANNNTADDSNSSEYFPSWSDILKECGVTDGSILSGKDSFNLVEVMISHSDKETVIANLDFAESDNEEAGYARFAIFKIHQTLKTNSNNMPDSSSMIDLSEAEECLFSKSPKCSSFFGTVYRLAPSSIGDVKE